MSDIREAAVSSSQKGAWGESLASAWLIMREYEVFVGMGNPSCDLVAIREGVVYRVEVKVAYTHKDRSNGWYLVSSVKPDKFDILLIVFPDGKVVESSEIGLEIRHGSITFPVAAAPT